MKKLWMPVLMVCVSAGFLVAGPVGGGGDADSVQIVISPKNLVMSSRVDWVTVHTNLAIGIVARQTVELNGIPAALTKADSTGNLVAKFDVKAVKAIVAPPTATLTLTGVLLNGQEFAASDTISVKK